MKPVQYHLRLRRGELAPNILLCGDPARTHKVARFFDRITLRRSNREFITCTGYYKKMPISVISTGIGADNTEIVMVELSQLVKHANIIRIGSCGGLKPNIKLGDLVITTGAVRLENTTLFFVPEGYPAIAHYEVISALKETADQLKVRYHLGLTATAPGFYGPQGRKVAGFPLRFRRMTIELREMGVLNFEMETSAVLTLAQIRGYRAGSVCAVYADRYHYKFISPALMKQAELRCIRVGLKALKKLDSHDYT